MDPRTDSEPTPVKNRTTVERKSEREFVVTRTFNGPARLVFGHDASETMAFFGKYIEVTPHSRLVWTNEEGGGEAVTTVTFEEKGGKTLLVLHERHPSKEAVDEAIGFGEGLRETFGQLDELLVSLNTVEPWGS